MASVRFGAAWGPLRRIFGAGTASGLGDADLLGRFAIDRDEAAFAALVARHGPMVLATARGVLRSVDDAEDAFQATFLVLARKAGTVRVAGSLGPWLHRVARRVAVQANADDARRRARERARGVVESRGPGSPWDDLIPRLHEEIGRLPEKYRAPIVLCDLGALTRDEAAGQLGWPPGTVAGRLARGRKLLHDRLSRRGATPTLAGLGASPVKPVPPGWIEATIEGATLGASSASGLAALWCREVMKAMSLTKLKATAAVFVTLAATSGLVAAGLARRPAEGRQAPAAQSAPPAVAGPAEAGPQLVAEPLPVPAGSPVETYEIRGRVLGPDGQPFAGARVAWYARGFVGYIVPAASTTSDAAGRFRITAVRPKRPKTATTVDGRVETFLPKEDPYGLLATAEGFGPGLLEHDPNAREATVRLAKDDAPIVGRVLDIQGRPVAGARIRPLALYLPAAGPDLTPWLDALKAARDYNGKLRAGNHLSDYLQGRRGVFATGFATGSSGLDGVIRLAGLGRERVLKASIEGPGIESRVVLIATRPMATLRVESFSAAGRKIISNADEDGIVYGATFDHVAAPSRAVEGVIRDRDSGAPLAGVVVQSLRKSLFEREPGAVQAASDKEGRFRLEGLPEGATVAVEVVPPDESPYPGATRPVAVGQGPGAASLDVPLRRGVWVTGRITDAATGKTPGSGHRIDYYVFAANPNLPPRPFRPIGQTRWATPDGTYRVLAYPGRGLVAVLGDTFKYVRGAGAEAIAGVEPSGFPTHPSFFHPLNCNTVVEVNPPVGAESVTADVRLESGRSRAGRVLDPEGRPLAGAKVAGLTDLGQDLLATADFRVEKLVPGRPRRLVFRHDGRKLAGLVDLKEADGPTLSVPLAPWASLSGRWLDEDGRPVRGALAVNLPEGRTSLLDGGVPQRPWRFRTDAEGRFRVEAMIPGQPYNISPDFEESPGLQGLIARNLALKPGEHRDLGDVRLKPAE